MRSNLAFRFAHKDAATRGELQVLLTVAGETLRIRAARLLSLHHPRNRQQERKRQE